MIKKHFLNEILSPKLLVIAWGFIIVICVFIGFSIRGKCATSQNQLPFEFDKVDNYNDWITQDIIDSIDNYGLPIYDENYVLNVLDLGYYGVEGNYLIYRGWFSLIPIDKFGNTSVNQDFYNTPLSYSKISGSNVYYFGVHFDYYGGFTPIVFSVVNNFNDLGTLFGHTPSIITIAGNSHVFTSYVPGYFNKNFYSNNDNLVLEFNDVPIVENGHATPPDLTGDNIGSDKPDIDDYIPNLPTMPTLDNSSLEKIAESIYNILQWGFNALKGTIQGLFEYLGDLLSYSFQKVIDNIKNAIKNLYDNFESLFSPLLNGIADLLDSISQKLDYISQPFDSEALQEAFENTAISGDIDSISQLNEQAFGTWSTTEEPNEFKIALHTEQIPLADNVNFTATTQYIDLGVINGAKPYIRGVMWCLVTFSLLYTIIDSIPNYIGGNDE